MQFIIDSEVCAQEGISVAEAFVLCTAKFSKLRDIISGLDKKYYIDFKKNYTLTPDGDRIVNSILSNNENSYFRNHTFDELVLEMYKAYPRYTRSSGTIVRNNRKEVASHLAAFFEVYGYKYSTDEILKAVKNYVAAVTDYEYIKDLKYFIFKIVDKETTSDLFTYLENQE